MGKVKKAKKNVAPIQPYKFRKRYKQVDIYIRKEKNFLYFIAFSLILAGLVYPYASIAMWVGFAFAGY